MIIALTPDSLFRHKYLLCLRGPVDEAAFLRRAKVKSGTYAGDLIANLHDRIFHRSLELKSDYAKYYNVEYATFAEYSRRRFLFPADVVNGLSLQFPRTRLIIYLHPGYSFLEDDYGREFLEKLLEPRRKK
jgi:hypothetical protein